MKRSRHAARLAVLCWAVAMIAAAAGHGEPSAIETRFACVDAQVLALMLTRPAPHDAVAIEEALRAGVCRYSATPLKVTPVRIVRQVGTTRRAQEPVGYIWAIRLGRRQVEYWFFWQGEHAAMLKRLAGT